MTRHVGTQKAKQYQARHAEVAGLKDTHIGGVGGGEEDAVEALRPSGFMGGQCIMTSSYDIGDAGRDSSSSSNGGAGSSQNSGAFGVYWGRSSITGAMASSVEVPYKAADKRSGALDSRLRASDNEIEATVMGHSSLISDAPRKDITT